VIVVTKVAKHDGNPPSRGAELAPVHPPVTALFPRWM
jgi:hypothetical protein